MSPGVCGVPCQKCGASGNAAHKFCAFCGNALMTSTPIPEKMRHGPSLGSQETVPSSDLHLVVRRTFLQVEEVGDVEPSSKPRCFTDSFLETKDASACSASTSEGSTPSSPSVASTLQPISNEIIEVACQPIPPPSHPAESPPRPQKPSLRPPPAPRMCGTPSHQYAGAAPQHMGSGAAAGLVATEGQQGRGPLHALDAENSKLAHFKSAIRKIPGAPRTTVMLRNLPLEYTREMFVELLDAEAFYGLYNFVYFPVDFCTQSGLGYAIVDMITHSDAVCFWKHFDGFSQWTVESDKLCMVDWSGPQQGLAAHVDRYRNSPVMHSSVPDVCRPLLFRNGLRVAFPSPTKPIKAPRLRGGK